ncbi:MAG: imidazolonepropionase [Acidobacteriaceae bacterium]|nr:imidazolonepropionase [Acidobacteriaceae bacterium]
MDESTALAVLNCRQIVTLAGPARPRVRDEMQDLAIVDNAAMLVRDGLIESIASPAELEIGDDIPVVDAAGGIVLPGFVDAHTHAVFAGTRVDEYERRAKGETYEQIAAAGGGVRSTVEKTRAALEDDLLETGRRYANWFTRCGTTTLEAKSGYGLTTESELKILRVIQQLGHVPTFLGAHDIPNEYRHDPDAYVDLVMNQMLPAVVEHGLAEYCDVFCERNVFTIDQSRAILTRARELGLGLRIHADQLSRNGGAELAGSLRTASADHLEQVDAPGIEALAHASVQPVLLPASVYCLGRDRFPPARQMIEAGLGVVLATDFNPGSSPTPSMPFVLSLACTHMRMTPAEAITAATINAAYSLGRGQEIGSLEPGKRADFVIYDCEDYREIPYFAGVELASSVYIGGNAAYTRPDGSDQTCFQESMATMQSFPVWSMRTRTPFSE